MVSIHWSIACIAVLGTGYSASAGVVSGSQTFYNMSASSRTYTYYQYAPVSGGSGGSVMNGSITATLTDLNGNGASLSNDPVGNAIYTATINGVAVQALWESPEFGFAVGQFLSGATVPASFANTPVPAGVPADGNAGVVLRFTLSAGDAVSFAYTFNVVPGPGVLALLACAGCAAYGRRRKS
ncbi:MAG: hypothetical protein RIR77_1906 [Planctomycetota bacterium]